MLHSSARVLHTSIQIWYRVALDFPLVMYIYFLVRYISAPDQHGTASATGFCLIEVTLKPK